MEESPGHWDVSASSIRAFSPLPSSFYARGAVLVARELLGMTILRRTREGLAAGRIVETEAYLGSSDTASHSFRGRTPRNASMFGPPGRSYVYSIHSRYCMNVVVEEIDVAHAVLIRAVEPVRGIELMQRRRDRIRPLDLARGPGRLCEALAIDRDLDRWELTRGERLWIAAVDDQGPASESTIGCSPRIGVTSARESLLRFYLRGSPFVSGPRRLNR